MVDRAGMRDALAETRRYLLSHHEPAEHDRCHAPVVVGRRLRVCARCSGIYPGIAGGVAAAVAGPAWLSSLLVVTVLPAPALVDWTATTATTRRGSNWLRTATGLLLGYAYGVGLGRLLVAGDRRVLAVGVAYGLPALALLWVLDRDATRSTPGGGDSY